MQGNIDDVPVGGGGAKTSPPEEFASTSAQVVDNSGPIEQRLASKNWLVRANAFEELSTQFKAADSEFAQEFKDHASMWKKYLSDANPGALEKCIDALEVFINRADPKLVASSQNDIIKILIEKCVGHMKPTIKSKSIECFNLVFEVSETFDESVETISECLSSKNVKINTSALVALNSWLASYGVKKVKIKSFLTLVENAAGSSNPTIRAEAMNFYKECYKFLGEQLKPLITNLKKQQLDDLEKDFQTLKDQPLGQLRLTRTEQKKQKDQALDEIIQKEEEEKKGEVDLYDLVDAVDLLTKYGTAEWQDKISALKVWKEKKEMLEELLNDSNVPKIKSGDFSGLVKILKKMVGDSNIVVSQTAVKVCGNLAKGLRKDFEPSCKELAPSLIGRFKDKKTQVIEEVNAVLDSFLLCTSLENILPEVVASLSDKSPLVKKQVCLFIEKASQVTYIDVLQRISGEMLQALIKASDDSQGDVRDAALQALGILKGRLGESAMSKFIQDLNPQKLQKLNESAQNVKPSKYDRPEKQEAPKSAPPPKKAAPAAKKAPVKKQQAVKDEEKVEDQPLPQANNENKDMTNLDEQPVGGSGGGYPTNFDDMPIGGGGNKGGDGFDEQPIGGAKGGGYDLSKLDEFDAFGGGGGFGNPPPLKKKKPPARFLKRMAEEEKKEGDVVMNDETEIKQEPPKKAPAKQPPEPKAKPSTTTVKTTSKGPTGPQIQDEDIGTGLSKEEAEAKVQETFPADIVSKFEEAKWQEKVEGFKGLSEQVASMQPSQDVIEALAKFIKAKMKDWKESNINLIKETINLFTVIAINCEKVNKRAVACLIPFLSEKVGDVKFVQTISELLLKLSELVTPKYIALQLMKHASTAKSPNVLKENCNMLIKMTEDFGAMNMALKEMIDYGILAANHTNPQVRTASMALFAIMYKHAGEAIRNFLKDIKESTLKLIEDEFGKVTPYKKGEFQQKRNFRGEAAAVVSEAPKKGGAGVIQSMLDDALPRQDISKQLNSKLMPMFKHSDWKTRKKAAEKVEEICKEANMRIKPDGLNELMDNIKQRMVDPNKAVLKSYIQLMGLLVEALGPSAKQFHKRLLPGMLATLADKQTLVRADAIACMDKWAEHVGPEIIINSVGPMLTQENPELRTEALKWIIKQKDAIKTSEVKDMVKPLVQCLSDRAPAIRTMAEEVICSVMPITGYQAFQAVMADLLPAVANTIKPILEKVKQKVGPINVAQDQMMGSSGAPQKSSQQQQPEQKSHPPLLKQGSVKPQIRPKVQGSTTNVASGGGLVGVQQNLNQSLQPTSSKPTLKKREMGTPSSNKNQQRSGSRDELKLKGLNQTMSSFKAPQQQQDAEPEQVNVNFGFKERRMEFDRKTKFQLEDIKSDQIERLRQFTNQSLGQQFSAKMFSNDFKLHLECIDAFTLMMTTNSDGLKEILDLIFKWALVKLADSGNTKFAVSIFDFFNSLFHHLEDTEYFLWDFEAQIIVPLLCEKTGLNNNILKEKVKKLIRSLYTIYDVKKCYLLIVQYGLQSKNMRAQAECLDELAEYIIKFGIENTSSKELKLVAKMADNNDRSIRENALKFMGEIYKLLDDDIWRSIGDVTPKVQGLLEQRFKKLRQGGGLQQSSSQANFHRPDTNNMSLGREQASPKTSFNPAFKTQQSFGLKKSIQQKSGITPRSNLQFNRSIAKPESSSALSRSINQFNQSNRSNRSNISNDDHQKTPQGFSQKAEMLKNMSSQERTMQQDFMQKRAIPQTQRLNSSTSGFGQVQRNTEPVQQQQQNLKNSFQNFRQQAQAVTKNTQVFYGGGAGNDDDDEDLRILTSDDNFGIDPEFARAQEEITKHIHQLKYADLSKRVDSLVFLNEMISSIDQNKPVLIKTANDLVSAYTHVLIDIFDKSVEDIPLRFAKYFITIVLKTCSCKDIMKEVSEERIFDLAEQLLTRLLIENLDKVGDNKEGELILKNLNSSMLRLLENCNHTYIFCVLFNLLRKYKDYGLLPKLPNLIIKCLLKLSKILEKLIDRLDMEKILLAIHEYLVVINHENKTQNDEMGIRIVKTVTNELVKLKRESIWEAYRVIQCHGQPDNHIYRWIQIILKSLQTQGSTTTSAISGNSTQTSNDFEIRQIVEELRNPEKFEQAIPKLQTFLDQNPQIDLNDYLQECSKTFQQFIKTNLEKHKLSLSKQQQDHGMQDSMKSTNNSDTVNQVQPQEPVQLKLQHMNSTDTSSNRISEYQSKLASIRMRNKQRSGAETATHKQQSNLTGAVGTQPLNTSFSAMNSSLSQRWHQINQKSAIQKKEGIHQMSSTMGGFGQAHGNFESKIGMGANTTQQPMNQSIGARSSGEQTMGGGATSQELNKRLAEMKAKLQALKKR